MVIGPEFETRVLEAVVGIDADALLGALDEAVAAGLLAEGGAGCYRFAHALVQAALYDQLSAARRARMHRRVGDAVETVYAARLEEHFAELAHHFMHAAPDSATRGCPTIVRLTGSSALVASVLAWSVSL